MGTLKTVIPYNNFSLYLYRQKNTFPVLLLSTLYGRLPQVGGLSLARARHLLQYGRSRAHSRPTFSSHEIVRVNDDPLLSHSCNPSIRKVDKATRKLFPALHTSFRRRTALRTIARIPGLQTSVFHSGPRLSKWCDQQVCSHDQLIHTISRP